MWRKGKAPKREAESHRPAWAAAALVEEDKLAEGLGTGGKAFVTFCARSTQVFLTNNNMQMAAAVAFYSFFSLFPLSLLIILAYDFFVPQATALQEAQLARAISTFIPVTQDVIASAITRAAESKAAAGPLSLAALVWASTAVFATLRKGINSAWNLHVPRAWLKERVIDLGATTGAGVLFLGLLVATAAVRGVAEEEVPRGAIGLFTGPVWLNISSFLVTFLSLAVVYRVLPNRPVRWRDVLFGALIASISFEVAKAGFFLYTETRANTEVIYGSFTFVAVLLGWLYVSAAIVLIGALIAAIYTRLVARRIVSERAIWTFGVWPGIKHVRRWARRHVLARTEVKAESERVGPLV